MFCLVGYILPFKSRVQNLLELVNEAFVLLVCYQLLTFTDYLTDPQTREYAGYSLLATLVVCVLINMGVVSHLMVTQTLHNLKVKYRQWKFHKIQRKKAEDRKQKAILTNLAKQNKEIGDIESQKQPKSNVQVKKIQHSQTQIQQKLQQSSDKQNQKNQQAQKKNQSKPIQPQKNTGQFESQLVFNNYGAQLKQNDKKNQLKKQTNKLSKEEVKVKSFRQNQEKSKTSNANTKKKTQNLSQHKTQQHTLNNQPDQIKKKHANGGHQVQNREDVLLDFSQGDDRSQFVQYWSTKPAQNVQKRNNQIQLGSKNQELQIDNRNLIQVKPKPASIDMGKVLQNYIKPMTTVPQWQHQPANQLPQYRPGLQTYLTSNQEVPAIQSHHQNKHSIERSNNQDDILLDYSFREQNQSDLLEEWNEANNFVSSKNAKQISNPNQNYSQNERQFVAAKPKNTNKPPTNVNIMKNIPISANCELKTFSTPEEARLYNQQTGNNQNYFYTNDLGQQFQYMYPIVAKPKPQLSQDDALSKLPEVLKCLSKQGRQQFEEMFEEVPAPIQLELAQLFTKMNEMKPLNFKQFQQKLQQISQPVNELYDYAMHWSKLNSQNAKFAEVEDIDFESAVDYRSKKIPDIIQRFIKLQIENDEQMYQARFGQEPHLKNLAFEKLPPFEQFCGTVHGRVYWYKELLKKEEIRNFYPDLFD